MADLVTKTCDECGAIKREANHWSKMYDFNGGVIIAPFDAEDTIGVGVGPRKDLCSQSCVVRALNKSIAFVTE